MFENCKAYNRPDSRLYKDGCKLQKILNDKKDEQIAGSEDGVMSTKDDSDVSVFLNVTRRLALDA